MTIYYKERIYHSTDGIPIHYKIWRPESPKAIIQIAHGMAEHSGRYKHFAEFMVEKGYGVYANDHRGHGKTAGSLQELGFFAEQEGWNRAVEDLHQLTKIIKKTEGEVAIFLLGHSMGSLLSRTYIQRHYQAIDGIIISGTSGSQGILGELGRIVVWFEIMRLGIKGRSPLMNTLVFGKFNKSFKPNRTEYDWLCRDEAAVDEYIKDEFCGGVGTTLFYRDVLLGIKKANRTELLKEVPKGLPVFIFSGDKDPVGNDGKGVKQVYDSMVKIGFDDVTLKLYKDGRHEMLNEVNRYEVYNDILMWLEERYYSLSLQRRFL